MKKITLITVVVIFLVVGGVAFYKMRDSSMPAPSPSISPIPSGVPPIDFSKLPAKASCKLKGTIRYVSLKPNIYDNGDALFSYSGVDEEGRNVLWKVTPDDGIDMGPSIFTQLKIPDGSSLLSVTLPDFPTAKRYTVTASLQYGRFVDGSLRVLIAPCSGSTTILLP